MGCFSFICKTCGEPINSDSFRGERCKLFLLKDGKIIEQMEGEYDSYGRVFDEEYNRVKWNLEWSGVCDLMFKKEMDNGIAAFHSQCYNDVAPVTRSEDDPDQGWGTFKLP